MLAVAGIAGFSTAIGIHPINGYDSATHLLPAIIAAVLFLTGLAFTFTPMM